MNNREEIKLIKSILVAIVGELISVSSISRQDAFLKIIEDISRLAPSPENCKHDFKDQVILNERVCEFCGTTVTF
jgi:hypothetical protein